MNTCVPPSIFISKTLHTQTHRDGWNPFEPLPDPNVFSFPDPPRDNYLESGISHFYALFYAFSSILSLVTKKWINKFVFCIRVYQ